MLLTYNLCCGPDKRTMRWVGGGFWLISRVCRRWLFLLVTFTVVGQAAEAPNPSERGAGAVQIDRFEFQYGLAHPALPAVSEIDTASVRLAQREGVWHSGTAGEGETLAVGHIAGGNLFDAGALREVAQGVVRWFNARGIFGVWVNFPELEATAAGVTDNRPAGDHTARMVVWASQVVEVRTLARGGRFKPAFSINNRKHRQILAGSPLRPGATPDQPGSLFRQAPLEAYLRELSLHPGRRVEASIASAGAPGKIVLDYLVNEPSAWQLFSQFANTGTQSTGQWRARLGYQNNQLTNHDDILNVDVITTPDFGTYGTFLSYRVPLLRPAKLFARVFGSYGDFLSSDATLQNLRFVGKNWLGGAELTHRLELRHGWTLESALGAQFVHYEIESQISGSTLAHGYSNFLIPYLSETIGWQGRTATLSSSLRFDSTVGSIANTDTTDGIPTLGRIGADATWTSLRWSLGGTVYLDRLFSREVTGSALPAHELSLRTWGKFLLRGKRLIPQVQDPLGGAFSVRGYPESILSADEFESGSVEYAFHLPRVFGTGKAGRIFGHPFKWRPAAAEQPPDWDLIFRAFYDYSYRKVAPLAVSGSASNGGVSLIDRSLAMAGAGGGMELTVRQNLSIRCDVGMALNELRDVTRPVGQQVVVPPGNVQTYLIATFVW